MDSADDILAILDRCCDAFTFPMLDNGYVYLAATRMALFRSQSDWAIVIEVFGYSPRAFVPEVTVQTFASRLHDRDPRENYVSEAACREYLSQNPNNEFRAFYPIEEGEWMDADNGEFVASGVEELLVRDQRIRLPSREAYTAAGVTLASPEHIEVFELCRYLAERHRDLVLASSSERRVSVLPVMSQLLCLDAWHHPDVADSTVRPSGSETFQQLARVVETGDTSHYAPTRPPNTHWSNWPEGGTL